MAAQVVRKKLYFDLSYTFTVSQRVSTVTAFQITQNASGPFDRYGGLLSQLPVITGGSPADIKRQNAVSAWFAETSGTKILDNTSCIQTTAAVRFVRSDGTTPITYLTAGGGTVAAKAGTDAVYSQNPFVQVRLYRESVGVTMSGAGVLYVQKQHSIEV